MNEGMNVRKILSAVGVVCCGLPWEGDIGWTRCKECSRKSGRACHLEQRWGKFLRFPLSIEVLILFRYKMC